MLVRVEWHRLPEPAFQSEPVFFQGAHQTARNQQNVPRRHLLPLYFHEMGLGQQLAGRTGCCGKQRFHLCLNGVSDAAARSIALTIQLGR
jgi:hypothetical protein